MFESPVNRDPARPPRLPGNCLGADDVARVIEAVEILPGEDVPIAVEKRAPQMRRQRAQSFQIMLVTGVDRIVGDARGNEIVIGRIVLGGIFHARRGLLVNPQRFHPRVTDVAGIRRRGHARKRAGHGTSVAAGEELPLAQGEKRQLVHADEEKFGALILVDIVLVLAVAEARGRTVRPRDQMLRFLETLVQLARDVTAKIMQEGLLKLGERAAQQQRVGVGRFVRLDNRLHQQRFRFPRPCGAAEEAVFRR